MRRTSLIFICFVAVQLAGPMKADAWWEYIEALSGPKLHGPHIEGRILCFMEEREKQDEEKLGLVPFVSIGVVAPCAFRIGQGDRRKASIDLGLRFLWDKHPASTGGKRIVFTSLEPAVTWNPIRRPDRDVFDFGVGAGMYWFSSEAFPSFRGFFVEPFRADLHIPTTWRSKSEWTALVPTVRAGVLVFPAGFAPNAFAGPGLTTPRIPGEAVKYWGFFFDLEALYQRRP